MALASARIVCAASGELRSILASVVNASTSLDVVANSAAIGGRASKLMYLLTWPSLLPINRPTAAALPCCLTARAIASAVSRALMSSRCRFSINWRISTCSRVIPTG